MLILPERNVPKGKILLPQLKNEWCLPSTRESIFGIENLNRWAITAKTHDGVVLWRGWFDSREDCDAVLYAIALGTINKLPALWDLSLPSWPGLDPGLLYAVDTYNYITSTATTPTYTVPGDFSATNQVHLVGAGGGGNNTGTGADRKGGGGGGYGGTTNISNLPGSSVTYQVGAAGTFFQTPAVHDTWWDAASYAAASVKSSGGYGMVGGVGSTYSGGTGNQGSGSSATGGGAAGPNGAGGNGGGSTGGAGDAGFGGAGGSSGPGGDGTEWGSYGCGGGGSVLANGGNYGGGGGGGNGAQPTGRQGLIVVIYTPVHRNSLNMPNLGL